MFFFSPILMCTSFPYHYPGTMWKPSWGIFNLFTLRSSIRLFRNARLWLSAPFISRFVRSEGICGRWRIWLDRKDFGKWNFVFCSLSSSLYGNVHNNDVQAKSGLLQEWPCQTLDTLTSFLCRFWRLKIFCASLIWTFPFRYPQN